MPDIISDVLIGIVLLKPSKKKIWLMVIPKMAHKKRRTRSLRAITKERLVNKMNRRKKIVVQHMRIQITDDACMGTGIAIFAMV